MIKVALIGLGKQNTKDHLDALLKLDLAQIACVCDSDSKLAKLWGEKLGVPHFSNIKTLVDKCDIDAAIVAVPHNKYRTIIETLTKNGTHVLKEKPFAMDLKEAKELLKLSKKHNTKLSVAVQRRYSGIYKKYDDYSKRIGQIFSIHGEYTLNIPNLSEGWRSSKKLAGGGTVLDMGYHLIDLLVWYFGMPERISAELGYRNRDDQKYDVEDTAKIQFSYTFGNKKVLGSMLLSRIYPEKDESLSIYGVNGAIKIYKEKIELYNADRELIESTFIKHEGYDTLHQLEDFLDCVKSRGREGNAESHLESMIFIDSVYRSDKEGIIVKPFSDNAYSDILIAK